MLAVEVQVATLEVLTALEAQAVEVQELEMVPQMLELLTLAAVEVLTEKAV
jgi:hypothetical protein